MSGDKKHAYVLGKYMALQKSKSRNQQDYLFYKWILLKVVFIYIVISFLQLIVKNRQKCQKIPKMTNEISKKLPDFMKNKSLNHILNTLAINNSVSKKNRQILQKGCNVLH